MYVSCKQVLFLRKSLEKKELVKYEVKMLKLKDIYRKVFLMKFFVPSLFFRHAFSIFLEVIGNKSIYT